MIMNAIFLFTIYWFPDFAIGIGNGTCHHRRDEESGVLMKVCCTDFIYNATTDQCQGLLEGLESFSSSGPKIKCSSGYHGQNCRNKCSGGYYGILCRDECTCKDNQRCHYIYGCISETTITVEDKSNFQDTTKQLETVREDSDTTAYFQFTTTAGTIKKSPDNIFPITTICVLTVLLLICSIINYTRSRCGNTTSSVKHGIEVGNADNIDVYGYHEINEDNIIEIDSKEICPPTLPNRAETDTLGTNNMRLNTETTISQSNENAHLDPHQSNREIDHHVKKRTTDQTEDEYLQPYVGCEEEESKINEHNGTGELEKQYYLNPYQPVLQENIEVHEYESTSEMKKKDYMNPYQQVLQENIEVHEYKSTSEIKKKDYMNPYQPVLQEAIDVHEYKSIGKMRKKDYMNPYQPVLDKNIEVHEYQSISERKEEDFLNPFQPVLRENFDVHEYKSTGERKKEVNLNPYQLDLQENIDVHEYKSTSEMKKK